MKIGLQTISAAIASTTLCLSAYAAPAKVKTSSDTFQKSGWRPYFGLMYTVDSTSMKRKSNGSTFSGFVDGPDKFEIESANVYNYNYGRSGGSNALDFVAGIGKVYENNLYLGLEGNFYWSTKAKFQANPQERDENLMGVDSSLGSNYSIRPILDVGIRIGYVVQDKIMPYFKVGVASYSVIASPMQDIINNPSAYPLVNSPGGLWPSGDAMSGAALNSRAYGTYVTPFIGGGVDLKISQDLSLRAEYNYSVLKAEKSIIGQGNEVLADPNDTPISTVYTSVNNTEFTMHKFKLGLVYTL